MQQSTQRPVSSIAYPILIALSISHCLNDLLQSVITATYPLFKEDFNVEFCTNRINYAGLSDVRIGVPTRIRIIF